MTRPVFFIVRVPRQCHGPYAILELRSDKRKGKDSIKVDFLSREVNFKGRLTALNGRRSTVKGCRSTDGRGVVWVSQVPVLS